MKKRFFAGLLCLVMLTSMLAGLTVAAEGYTEIDLSSTKETAITAGGTTQLWVNGADASNLTGITYTSSNEEYATVSSTGLVEGKKAGITKITATAGDYSDSVMIIVSDSAIKDVALTPVWYTPERGILEEDFALTRVSGESTVKIKKSANMGSSMDLLTAGTTVSFWLYDDGTNPATIYLSADLNENVSGYTGIYPTYLVKKTPLYLYQRYNNNTYTRSYYANQYDDGFVTAEQKTLNGVNTKAGWHHVVYRFTDESVKIYYDGELLFNGIGRKKIKYNEFTASITNAAMNISDLQLSNTGNTEIDVEKGTTAAKKNVTFNVGENGSLGYWKSAIADDTTLSFSEGYPLSLKVTPADGYEIDSFKVGGAEYTLGDDGYVTLTISGDTTVDVTFKEPSTDPVVNVTAAVSKGGTTLGKDGETTYNTYIVYSDITNYGNIVGYGMKLTTASGETKELSAGFTAEKTALQLLADGEGKFAFRVYGEVIDTEKCTLTPYIVTEAGTQYCESSSDEFGLEPVQQ